MNTDANTNAAPIYTSPNSYIKADDNKVINETAIKWIKKIDDCLLICTKSIGCMEKLETNQVCKINNYNSYMKLNQLFGDK